MTAAACLTERYTMIPQTDNWLSELRQRHWDAFVQNGLPTARQERWKYADLSWLPQLSYAPAMPIDDAGLADLVKSFRIKHAESILLVCVNGYFMPALSDIKQLPAGVIACTLLDAVQKHEPLVKNSWVDEKNVFACLNAALFADGLFLHVSDNVELTQPIHCLSLAVGDTSFAVHPRRLISLGRHSRMTLLDEHIGTATAPYLVNQASQITLGASAALTHYKLQREQSASTHLAATVIVQAKDSLYQGTYFSAGGRFARDEVSANVAAVGAVCHTGGYYHLTRDQQYVDYHIDIDHAAPRTQSDMVFKGVLDKRSRAVFNGRLHVLQDAQKITAHQQNHNILLSAQAEVYSKPELEIYADDVKCKHGATIGQIDKESLFYLRARGISEQEAISMLLKGFSEDVLQRVEAANMRVHIEEAMCL